MYAAMENKLQLVKQMIMLGCNINSVNNEGYTALHLGSMYAKEALVAFLLTKEADPAKTGGVSVLKYHFDAFFHTAKDNMVVNGIVRKIPFFWHVKAFL